MPVEVLIVDSGSTDGSLDIARRHGRARDRDTAERVLPRLTRNLAIEQATGDVVVFLTQDSTPASDRWLASMLEGFAQSDDVALVFGPHIARPEHSHVFAREMRDHFRTWGEVSASTCSASARRRRRTRITARFPASSSSSPT